MRVRVRDISPEGLTIDDTLSLERLNERMDEGRENHTHFTSKPKIELRLDRSPSGAETCGTVSADYLQPCARCAKLLQHKCAARADFVFHEKPPEMVSRGSHEDPEADASPYEDYTDDVGICYFNGEHIELEELLQEALILQINPFFQPQLTNEGRCIECGDVPRTEVAVEPQGATPKGLSLGVLLKRAGVAVEEK